MRPDHSFNLYVFALFNENLKPGPTSERYYGLFNPDGSAVYTMDIPAKDGGSNTTSSGGSGSGGGGGVLPIWLPPPGSYIPITSSSVSSLEIVISFWKFCSVPFLTNNFLVGYESDCLFS